MLSPFLFAGFANELAKLASAHGRMEVSKARTGRRPISVDKLIEKHNEGTLYKKADSAGRPEEVRGAGADDPGAAKLPKRPGEVPSKGVGDIPEDEKLGQVSWRAFAAELRKLAGNQSYRLTDTTMPFLTGGPTSMSGPETLKPRQPGDVPTQEYMGLDQSAMPIGGRPITNDISAKKPKKGDVPTQDRDINLIDRVDQRDFTTTVTGLAQNSSGIGAGIGGGEHS